MEISLYRNIRDKNEERKVSQMGMCEKRINSQAVMNHGKQGHKNKRENGKFAEADSVT